MSIDRTQSRISPDFITDLPANTVFVFGSNLAGIHGAGAARLARTEFGAVPGQARGPQGRSYAIPTRDERIRTLPTGFIGTEIKAFIRYAELNPDQTFWVTAIGTGLAGYSPADIAPLFLRAIDVENIYLPQGFWDVLLQP